MRFPRFVLPLLVGLWCCFSATAAQAVPCSGQPGPDVGEASFLDPPNDEYCTFVDLSSCGGAAAVTAHWRLFWSGVCTIPAQVYLREANLVSGSCYTPGAIVGTPAALGLVGANSISVDHVSPPIRVPSGGSGKFFICFKVVSNGTCPDGTPLGNPHLRLDAVNDACQSYNITPGGTAELTGLSGNPVMWVEKVPCIDGQLGPGTGDLSFLDPPNDEYCTYVNLSECTSTDPLRAFWQLFWSSACTIPAQVQFRTAVDNGQGCFSPGATIGNPVPYDLIGIAGQNVNHPSPPIPHPGGPGHYFVCITVLSNGTCSDGTPMGNPRLRTNGARDVCQSYNPPNRDLIAVAGLGGNPVMWVEPAPRQPPDNQPPDCSAAFATPDKIRSHDGRFKSIGVLGVTDPDGDKVTITITGVTQDEPVSGRKAGRTCPDARFSGNQVSVRAERSKERPKDGRVYVISFTASDGNGGTCDGSVKVCVVDNKRFSRKDLAVIDEGGDQFASGGHGPGNRDCVDSGQSYNSLGPCPKHGHDHDMLAEDVLDLAVNEITSNTAEISFSVPSEGHVEVAVFDLLGRRMATLESASMTTGIHETVWKMDSAKKGLYFVRITKGEEVVTRQVIKLQ